MLDMGSELWIQIPAPPKTDCVSHCKLFSGFSIPQMWMIMWAEQKEENNAYQCLACDNHTIHALVVPRYIHLTWRDHVLFAKPSVSVCVSLHFSIFPCACITCLSLFLHISLTSSQTLVSHPFSFFKLFSLCLCLCLCLSLNSLSYSFSHSLSPSLPPSVSLSLFCTEVHCSSFSIFV